MGLRKQLLLYAYGSQREGLILGFLSLDTQFIVAYLASGYHKLRERGIILILPLIKKINRGSAVSEGKLFKR